MCKAEATVAVNDFISGLYHEGVFIPKLQATRLAMRGLEFLKLYVELAQLSFSRKRQRFPLIPKGHFLHHQVLDLLHQGQQCPWAVNLLVYACQAQEDYVGKPSRLTRRTNPRTAPQRTIQRTFLAIRNALQSQSEFSKEKLN